MIINTPKIKLHMSAVGILIHVSNLNQFTKKICSDVQTFSADYIVMQISIV